MEKRFQKTFSSWEKKSEKSKKRHDSSSGTMVSGGVPGGKDECRLAKTGACQPSHSWNQNERPQT